MTRREQRIVKAALAGDALIVEARRALHRARDLAREAQDYEADAVLNCAVNALSGVTIYPIKTLRVEVDESK